MDIIEEARSNQIASKVADHDNRLVALEKTAVLIIEIHTALIGTLKEPGLIKEIKDHTEFIASCKIRHAENKKQSIDWKKWGERLVIAAMFTWILAKVGIK